MFLLKVRLPDKQLKKNGTSSFKKLLNQKKRSQQQQQQQKIKANNTQGTLKH